MFHIACVMDVGSSWEARVLTLLQSIRTYGGIVGAAPFTVVTVGEVSPWFVPAVRDLSGTVEVAAPVFPDRPFMNKVRGLEIESKSDVVLLDCDTVVVADIHGLAPIEGAVRAKIDDADPFTPQHWEALERRIGPLGYGGQRTTVTQQATGLFLNSGVLAVAREDRENLACSWRMRFPSIDQLVSRIHPQKAFFAEQVALGAAILDLNLRVDKLGVEYNWPAHIAPVPAGVAPPEPRLIHYHAMAKGSRIMAPLAPAWVQVRLDALADRATGELRQPGREAARDKQGVLQATERLRRRSSGRSHIGPTHKPRVPTDSGQVG